MLTIISIAVIYKLVTMLRMSAIITKLVRTEESKITRLVKTFKVNYFVNYPETIYNLKQIYYLLEKYPTFFSPENLVDLNEVRSHEATLNLNTHA